MSNSGTPPPSPPSRIIPGAPRYRNHGTMMPTDPRFAELWRSMKKHSVLPHQRAYALALAADKLRERQAEIGYRLYWMSDTILGSIEIDAQPNGYAIVGRHTSCDAVLDDETLVSLRHVLVRATALDDGFPVLSLLDLQSTSGFELSDGTKQRSIASSGPVVFRIGTHSLVALPSTGNLPEELPVPHVAPGVHPTSQRIAPVAVAIPKSEREPRSAPVSRITLLPASVDLANRRSVVPEAPWAHDSSHVPTGEGYELVLESRLNRAKVRFSNADLDHGVLIGRAEKCADAGLRSVLVEWVSRVHVLLIREKGECRLYDVASLHGTYVNGQRIRCLALADSGTSVGIARDSGVTLHWRAL